MRPIYVDMKAFGSYVDERIEFDKVKNGLFLITGQTGAGKTTVFDAITYALYGKTSGSMRNENMIHSNFASERAIPRVEYKFSYGKDIYTIIREAGGDDYTYVKKTNTWKKKASKRSEKVTLILPDGSEFVGKATETNEKIKEIVKLDVNQFQQVVMLAQGEFTKLIKAKSDERQEILTQIFDSTIYDMIEKNVQARFAKSKAMIDENKRDITNTLSTVKLLENSKHIDAWLSYPEKFSEAKSDELLSLVSMINDEIKEKEDSMNKEKKKLESLFNEYQSKLDAATSLNKKFDDLEKNIKEYNIHLQNKDKIQRIIIQNERANKAKEVDSFYQNYQSICKQLKEKESSLKECIQKIEKYKVFLVSLKETFEMASKAFDQEGPSILASIKTIEDTYPKYDQYNEMVRKVNTLSKEISSLMTSLEKMETSIVSKDKEMNALQDQQNKLLMERVDPKSYDSTIQMLSDKKKNLETFKKDIGTYKDELHSYFMLGNKLMKQQGIVQDSKEKYDAYYHSFISNQASLIRSSLKDGDICPVCGNIHHVSSNTKTIQSNTNADTLQQLKNKYEKENNVYNDLKADYVGKKSSVNQKEEYLKRTSIQLMGLEMDLKDHEIEATITSMIQSVQKEMNDTKNHQNKAKQDLISIQRNDKTLKEQKEELESLKAKKESSSNSLNDKKQELVLLNSSIEAYKKELIYASKQEAQKEVSSLKNQYKVLKEKKEQSEKNYQETLNQYTSESGKKETLEKDIVSLKENKETSNRILINKYEEYGFKDENEYLNARLDMKTISSNQKLIDDFKTKKNRYETTLEMLKKDTEHKERIDVSSIQITMKEVRDSLNQINKESRTIVSIHATNESAYKQACSLYESRKEYVAQFKVVNDVFEVVCGRVSKKHLTFKTFILRKYFKQMLRKANERLVVLSNNQFRLQCREIDELASSGKTGLEIDVYNMVTNKVSDAKGLSGGESFITALSMALGMADLIQLNNGSVRIDTMFIDEGFGSLSDEVRNQAVSILQSMTDQNRLIGIISHVSELKNQVDTQLIVTKDEKGSHHHWNY